MLNGWSVVIRIEDSLKSIIIQRMCLSYNCYDVDGCWQCNTHEDRYENDGTIKRMKKRKWRWWWRERGNGDDASVDVKEQDDSNNNNDPFPCSQKQLQMLWHETVLWARLWHTIDKPASISQPRYPLRGLEDVSGTFRVLYNISIFYVCRKGGCDTNTLMSFPDFPLLQGQEDLALMSVILHRDEGEMAHASIQPDQEARRQLHFPPPGDCSKRTFLPHVWLSLSDIVDKVFGYSGKTLE